MKTQTTSMRSQSKQNYRSNSQSKNIVQNKQTQKKYQEIRNPQNKFAKYTSSDQDYLQIKNYKKQQEINTQKSKKKKISLSKNIYQQSRLQNSSSATSISDIVESPHRIYPSKNLSQQESLNRFQKCLEQNKFGENQNQNQIDLNGTQQLKQKDLCRRQQQVSFNSIYGKCKNKSQIYPAYSQQIQFSQLIQFQSLNPFALNTASPIRFHQKLQQVTQKVSKQITKMLQTLACEGRQAKIKMNQNKNLSINHYQNYDNFLLLCKAKGCNREQGIILFLGKYCSRCFNRLLTLNQPGEKVRSVNQLNCVPKNIQTKRY